MKRVRTVKAGFRGLNDRELLSLTQTVEQAMTDNPNFENPSPSIESFSEVIVNFGIKLAISSKRGNPEDTQIKNEARKALEKVTDALVFYVNTVAEGDLRILLSSGFLLSKKHSRVLSPSIVAYVALKDGRQKGQMILNFEAQKNIRVYRYRYTDKRDASGEILWAGKEFETTSSRNNLIAPVIPGVVYYVSVQAVNSVTTSDWSDPITWIAR